MLDAFTGDTRHFQLTTAFGRDCLIVDSVHGGEGSGQQFRFHLSTLSNDPGISPKSLIGQPALLLIEAGRDTRRLFHGYITTAEHSGQERYQLSMEPWTAFLDRAPASRVFQNMTVFDILDCVFAPWQGRNRLAAHWRFDIGARANYPIRGLTTQHQESDLAFAERLMSEEGLSHYFEHAGAPNSPGLGRHILVIAEHNVSEPESPARKLAKSQPSQPAECAI